MRGITRDTWSELKSRKTLYAFGVVTLFAVGVTFLSHSVADKTINLQDGSSLTDSMADAVNMALLKSFSFFLAFLSLLAVVATAGLIPRMMEKGRAEFFLGKPIGRSQLFFGKLFSLWLVYGLAIAACGVISYICMGWLFDSFSLKIIVVFVAYLVNFGIWLTITGLIGVLSGSSAMAIICAISIWVAQYQLLENGAMIQALFNSKTVTVILDGLYYILPKTSEIIWTSEQLALGNTIKNWMPLWSSLLFAAVLLYLAVWLYGRKDY